MANANEIQIEVVYATASESKIIAIKVPINTTVREAIAASNIQSFFSDIDLNKNPVGIFSRLVSLDQTVHEGDRIEIYRSLTADPKQQRKLKAKQQTHLRKP